MHDQLAAMDAQQLREFAAGLIEHIDRQEHALGGDWIRIRTLHIDVERVFARL